MELVDVIDIGQEAIFVLLKVSLPLMLIALVIGLGVSFFQALTQIQEQTLTFVPKIVVVFLGMVFLMPFMVGTLIAFTHTIADRIIAIGT